MAIIARAHRVSAIRSLGKNLLIYSKLHEKNSFITNTNVTILLILYMKKFEMVK